MQDVTGQNEVGRKTPDYQLALDNIEKRILRGEASEDIHNLLSRKEVWQSLGPEESIRWSRLAQIAGIPELAVEVLEWANGTYPVYEPAWRERMDVLRTLGERTQLVAVRAAAIVALGEERARAALGIEGESDGDAPIDGDILTAQDRHEDLGTEDPFIELRREEENILLFMNLFRGREDAFARQWYDERNDSQGYVPVRRPLQPADVKDHLLGKRTYGIYLLSAESKAHVGLLDVDLAEKYRGRALTPDEREKVNREEQYLLKRLTELSAAAGMAAHAEFSGGKGYHLWYFFEQPVPAGVVRAALQGITAKVRGDVDSHTIEVFPKQDELSGKGFGNLVKLPLGIHRATGKGSFFLSASGKDHDAQFDFLRLSGRTPLSAMEAAASLFEKATVLVHPRHEAWAREYPELAQIEQKCSMLAQILASCRASRTLSVREERVLLGTLGHLPSARRLLHHVFEKLPEYNRPLLDFKISRVRGTTLGCKRIHSLMGDGEGGLPCRFDTTESGYGHPLLHVETWNPRDANPRSERVSNLADALEELVTTIRQVQRFLPPEER